MKAQMHLAHRTLSLRIGQWCVWAALVLAAFTGCATTPQPAPPQEAARPTEVPGAPEPVPQVVLDAPQRVALAVLISDAPLLSHVEQARQFDRTMERFFAPWDMSKSSLPREEAFWGLKAYGSRQGFAENLQPFPRERWERLTALQAMEAYPSMAAHGIVTRNTAMRVLPSLRPFFLDPSRPGEGFPFDYFQNSALWLGAPVFISHASRDQAWFFVETAFSAGWVRREDVAITDAEFHARYRSRDMAALRRDDTVLAGAGRFLGQSHIGAIFPLDSRTGQGLTVKVPLRGADGRAAIGLAPLSFWEAAPMPLPLTSREVAGLADAMAGQLYGWGGMFENRDCSSTLRDLFLPFGIWLPRNSSQQARQGGAAIPLAGMAGDEKLQVIHDRGVPFATLIWMPGHIGLYLGTDSRGQALLLHNIWGVRTSLPDGGEGRAVIGRLVVSTLRPGEERDDVEPGGFLGKVGGLTILGAE